MTAIKRRNFPEISAWLIQIFFSIDFIHWETYRLVKHIGELLGRWKSWSKASGTPLKQINVERLKKKKCISNIFFFFFPSYHYYSANDEKKRGKKSLKKGEEKIKIKGENSRWKFPRYIYEKKKKYVLETYRVFANEYHIGRTCAVFIICIIKSGMTSKNENVGTEAANTRPQQGFSLHGN